jgi:hypothetical protein
VLGAVLMLPSESPEPPAFRLMRLAAAGLGLASRATVALCSAAISDNEPTRGVPAPRSKFIPLAPTLTPEWGSTMCERESRRTFRAKIFPQATQILEEG